jgi:hypothetical protein
MCPCPCPLVKTVEPKIVRIPGGGGGGEAGADPGPMGMFIY